MVPTRSQKVDWEDGDIILLKIRREGMIHKIMHMIFKSPLNPTIELDEIGSFVWKSCDGVKNLHEIAEDLKVKYGEKIEPVYDRLLQYISILKNNNLIKLE